MNTCTLIHTVVILVCLNAVHSYEQEQKWSYFVFNQEWPPAACLEAPHGKCKIPDVVTEWTIHGLWPSSDKGWPSFCNGSMPFNPKSIASLRPGLEANWPNIFADSTENSFWKHEWMKHGTCSLTDKLFRNEYDYFKRSLELHDRLNIHEYIRKAGITPNEDKPVLLNYIEKAIYLQVNTTVKLFCKNHEEYSSPILNSIDVCLNKELYLIDCDKIHEPTCNSTYVFYLPFKDRINKYHK